MEIDVPPTKNRPSAGSTSKRARLGRPRTTGRRKPGSPTVSGRAKRSGTKSSLPKPRARSAGTKLAKRTRSTKGLPRPKARGATVTADWKQIVLRKISGAAVATAIVLLERRAGAGANSRLFVFCRELLADSPWAEPEAHRDGLSIVLEFPTDSFIGMPARLVLESPAEEVLGSRWVLRGEDGVRVEGMFHLTERFLHTGQKALELLEHYQRG
jgi:hypothetical protein